MPTVPLAICRSAGIHAPAVVRRLEEAGVEVAELALRLPSLDDVFLALTGHTTANGSTNGPAGGSGAAAGPGTGRSAA